MLLISCTIISFFIDRQMLPQAILAESRPVEGEHEKDTAAEPCGERGWGGTYVLMAETGDNWEEGLRVKAHSADRLERKGDLVVTNAAGKGGMWSCHQTAFGWAGDRRGKSGRNQKGPVSCGSKF